jgi:hypothetical protein
MGHTQSYYIGGKSVNARTECAICPNGDKCGSGASGPARGRVFSFSVLYHSSARNCGLREENKAVFFPELFLFS